MVMVTLNNRGWQKNAEDLQKRQAQTAHTRTGGSYSSKFHESARKAELLSVLFNESKGLKYRQLTILMYEVLFSSDPSPIIIFPKSMVSNHWPCSDLTDVTLACVKIRTTSPQPTQPLITVISCCQFCKPSCRCRNKTKAMLLMREQKKNMEMMLEQNKSHVANARTKTHDVDASTKEIHLLHAGTKQKQCC